MYNGSISFSSSITSVPISCDFDVQNSSQIHHVLKLHCADIIDTIIVPVRSAMTLLIVNNRHRLCRRTVALNHVTPVEVANTADVVIFEIESCNQ